MAQRGDVSAWKGAMGHSFLFHRSRDFAFKHELHGPLDFSQTGRRER